MQPTQQEPGRPDGGDRHGSDLVETLDRLLVRLDGLRDRPGLSTALSSLLVGALALVWVAGQWRAVEPLDDDLIPSIADQPISSLDGAQASTASSERDSRGTAAPGAEPGTGSGTTADVGGGGDGGAAAEAVGESEAAMMVVHVSGAVRVEGLFELPPGSRLADAVAAAGGGTADADIHRLNLATPVVDGMHIRVPGVDEADGPLPLIETAQAPTASGDGPRAPGDGGVVNVNQAGAAELERLPGVGPTIAAAIITWRDEHGPFQTVDDLLAVPGIGPAKLAAMEARVAL